MKYSNTLNPIAVGGQNARTLLGSAIEVPYDSVYIFNLMIPRILPVCLEINDQNIFVTGGDDLSGG